MIIFDMQHEDASISLCPSAGELPHFFQKRNNPIVIDIQSDSALSDCQGHQIRGPSFRQSVESFLKQVEERQETKANSNNGDSTDLERKQTNIYSEKQGCLMTSNCQFDLNLSLPTLSKSQKGQTSILSESASESQSLTNEMSGKKALKKIFEKLKEERVFDKKTRQAIIAFHYKYGDTDVYGRLKSDFWVHSKKSLQNIIDPRQKYLQKSEFFTKKITRQQFRQLRPLLNEIDDGKDIEQELERLENARYRYQSPKIVTAINNLAKKVNPQKMQHQKTVILPQQPPISVKSLRHTMMVRILKERLKKREVICLD